MNPLFTIGKAILEKNNSPAFQRIQGIAGGINSAKNLMSILSNLGV